MAKERRGIPKNRSGTPWNITPAILDFCGSINPAVQPVYVPVKPWPLAELDWCLDNTKLYISKHESHGHSIVNGWNIWETPGVWLEAEAHTIIRKKDGKFIDISPHAHGGHRTLFLPDSFNWEGGIVANRYYPLREDSRFLELVEAKRRVAEFRGRYPFGSVLVGPKGVGMFREQCPGIDFIELSESDELEYQMLDERVKSLMGELGLSQIK